jgi:hypothetical protein
MRGTDHQTGHLCGYVNPEAMVPLDYPMREIRPLVNAALERLSPTFEQIYSPIGRPSIPPEQLLRALLFQAFFTIRSERQLMEQLTYNILVRRSVGRGAGVGRDGVHQEPRPVAGGRHRLWLPAGDPG